MPSTYKYKTSKKRKTLKKVDSGKMKIFRSGNVFYCFKVTGMDKKKKGGANDDKIDYKRLVETVKKLNQENEKIKEMMNDPNFKTNLMQTVDELLKTGKITKEEHEDILNTLNNVNSNKTGIYSMGKNALKSLKNNAVSLGNWVSPFNPEKSSEVKDNSENIQLIWYPNQNRRYRKGQSLIPKDNEDIKYGDFMIIADSEKYSNMEEMLSKNLNGVDDLITNVMNGCQDAICDKGIVKPVFLKKRIVQINDKAPTIKKKEGIEKYNKIMRELNENEEETTDLQ